LAPCAVLAAAKLGGSDESTGVHLDGAVAKGDLPAYWEKRQGEHAYLEDVLGEQAMAWVAKENKHTVATLGDPAAKPLYGRIIDILESKEKIPHLTKIGDHYYNYWMDSTNPRGLWRRTTLERYEAASQGKGKAEVAWETVLDVDALGRREGESWEFKGARVCVGPRTRPTACSCPCRGAGPTPSWCGSSTWRRKASWRRRAGASW